MRSRSQAELAAILAGRAPDRRYIAAMRPEDAAAWLPVLRDYGALLLGILLAVAGILKGNVAAASAGFGLAGLGAGGRAAKALEGAGE